MSYTLTARRDPIKNYFPVPNEVYALGLKPTEVAIYGYLLRIEDRNTFECYASYKTIGKAVGVSTNTVRKYVRMLEERGLITTEHTTVTHKDGTRWNGVLKYCIRPVREALEIFHTKQIELAEEGKERQRVARLLDETPPVSPTEAVCAPFRSSADIVTEEAV